MKSRIVAAVVAGIATFHGFGLIVESLRPSSSRISAATCGRMIVPPLATAEPIERHLQRRRGDVTLADAGERERRLVVVERPRHRTGAHRGAR